MHPLEIFMESIYIVQVNTCYFQYITKKKKAKLTNLKIQPAKSADNDILANNAQVNTSTLSSCHHMKNVSS